MLKTQSNKLYNWAVQKADSRWSSFWIGLLFFAELVLFVPLDAILLFFCLHKRSKTLLYALIAMVASTVSAGIGYLVGYFLWDTVGPFITKYLITQETMTRMSGHYQNYQNLFAFLGALLPFPLKALTLSAGFCNLSLLPFLTCVMGARLLRFLLIGSSVLLWGEQVKEFIKRHFHKLFLLLGTKVALVFFFLWKIAH
jgi:membrane protein YqaA with SNARE-associated domain